MKILIDESLPRFTMIQRLQLVQLAYRMEKIVALIAALSDFAPQSFCCRRIIRCF